MEFLQEEERKEPLNQKLLFFDPITYSHAWPVQVLSPDLSELKEMGKVIQFYLHNSFLNKNSFKGVFQAIHAYWKDRYSNITIK